MGNYICLCNLQLVRGQQVCLAYSTKRKTLTGNILFYEDQIAPLTFTHQKTAFSDQPLLEKQSQLLSLTFAITQNNTNELSRAVLI